MDDNIAILLVLAVSILGAVALIVATRWLRTAQGGALKAENALLRSQVRGLTERLTTLERIATDPGARIAHEIEQLR